MTRTLSQIHYQAAKMDTKIGRLCSGGRGHMGILMSKCFDLRTTFPDTYRHFRPAIDISRIFPIVCGALRATTNKHARIRSPCFDMSDFQRISFWTPYVRNQGLSKAQFRIEIVSELCIRSPLCFTHGVHKYTCFVILFCHNPIVCNYIHIL